MKRKPLKWLIAPLVILLCGSFGLSQSIPRAKNLTYEIVICDSVWVESNKNIEMRKHQGIGFFYPYNLPDAENSALALFRTYQTPINCGYNILEVDDNNKSVKRLMGKIKFSGSDIDQTKDTLIIATYYSKTKNALLLANLNGGLVPIKANLVKISEPLAQFESFHIDLLQSINDEERKYLIIQLIIKSGSNDSFYYGNSNAVIDDFYFITN